MIASGLFDEPKEAYVARTCACRISWVTNLTFHRRERRAVRRAVLDFGESGPKGAIMLDDQTEGYPSPALARRSLMATSINGRHRTANPFQSVAWRNEERLTE